MSWFNCSKMFFFAAICAIAVGTSTLATSAPLNYSESISGDLSGYEAPLTNFNFGIGTNTISGSGILYSRGSFADGSLATDIDNFNFFIPTGTYVSGMRIDFQSTQLADGFSSIKALSVLYDNAWNGTNLVNQMGIGIVELVGGSVPVTEWLGPVVDLGGIGPGAYSYSEQFNLSPTDAGQIIFSDARVVPLATFNYTLNFEVVAGVLAPPVSAVPEPETYAMLLVGFGLLGINARRRRSKAASA